MAIRMARSSYYRDPQGVLLAGPGEILEGLTDEEEAALLRTGSAYQIDHPAARPAEEKET